MWVPWECFSLIGLLADTLYTRSWETKPKHEGHGTRARTWGRIAVYYQLWRRGCVRVKWPWALNQMTSKFIGGVIRSRRSDGSKLFIPGVAEHKIALGAEKYANQQTKRNEAIIYSDVSLGLWWTTHSEAAATFTYGFHAKFCTKGRPDPILISAWYQPKDEYPIIYIWRLCI